MLVGVPKEIGSGEKRVAISPEGVTKLKKLGYDVMVETGAGMGANFADADYEAQGASIAPGSKEIWSDTNIVLKVSAPSEDPSGATHEADLLSPNQTMIGFIWPAQNEELMARMAKTGGTVLAMDSIPRISRAQNYDALSTMANIAGYRAVIEASQHFGRFFTGQITAAGKVPPAKVMVIGAGVAGLAAIGTAVGMGAIVRAFDTRPVVKEQVESMNAEFLELEFEEDGSGEGGYAKTMSKEFIDAEMALFLEQAHEVDIIITTALIPGKPAPKLITEEMVKAMKPGGVVVDLAAEQGGNCECTVPGEVVKAHGVTIVGYSDFPSWMAAQSSQLYSNNLCNLMRELTPDKDGQIVVDMTDEVIRGATVIEHGNVTWPPPPPRLTAAPQPAAETAPVPVAAPKKQMSKGAKSVIGVVVVSAGLLAIGTVAPAAFMSQLTVFVLACFLGWQVVWNVTPALHTPLMSVTNAISGIIVLGAMMQMRSSSNLAIGLAAFAILMATINVAGGFLVTRRMLRMFQR
ncbi:MAG: Re/Si-specific NAD(P)(+) transhydrogenase subunit alpha [bacterium]|nr:Re/Si-specific NAD(P)(+) transhydrogenase subunit alpha [bacterium]